MTAAEKKREQPSARFLRSVRLETDLHRTDALGGYVVTPQTRLVLRRLILALKPGGMERAVTLTGPYGTGKSAFALFLTSLLSELQGEAFALLQKADGALARELAQAVSRPLLSVPLTLRRARLSLLLLEGIQQAAATLHAEPTWAAELVATIHNARESVDSSTVLAFAEHLKASAVEAGYGGLLVVFDELGKSLEFEARSGGEDLYLLQELAEVAARSGDAPLLFVGVLHQGFEQYGEHLLASARREWGKVQGRFADIAFLEPPEQQMRLAAQALSALQPAPSAALRAQGQAAAQALTESGQTPREIAPLEFAALSAQAAPLHPTALLALPHLFRRFAQNERSLFAYLLSGEPHAIPALWAQRHGTGSGVLIRLADLFDYFVQNLLGSLARHTFAKRWLEVLDALEREPGLPPLELAVLKTVGLLGVLGDLGTIHATYEVLCTALRDEPDSAEVRAALTHLQGKSLIVHRSYNRSYRVWEGSDIDIEERLEEGRRHASAALSLSETLERHLPRRPQVARRHSFDTGTLRYFEVRYADTPPVESRLRAETGDGLLLCALPGTAEAAEDFRRWAEGDDVTGRADLIVVIPEHLHALREAATEVRALHWLGDNTPELRDDRVARREVAERLAYLEANLGSSAEHLLDPRPTPQGSGARFYYGGNHLENIRTPRLAAQLLSDVFDELYSASPAVLNELVNRRSLSSAAAAARRTLIDQMLSSEGEPLLGLDPEAFPPERSMYESVLRETGLHRPADPNEEEGSWQFGSPPEGHRTNFAPVWQALRQAIFSAREPLSIAALGQQLAAAPYGLTDGLFPIVLTAFLQAHPHEISMYREGKFIPEPLIADLEVLMRRPELFAVMGSELRGARAAVIERLARGYSTSPALVPVVRALFRGVRSLPDTAQRTKHLPDAVLRLRDTFTQARSPEQLLFDDIPSALGLPPIGEDETTPEQIAVFFTALNAANTTWADHAPTQVEQARATLLSALGFPSTAQGWQALVEQAGQLKDRPLPTSLTPLINRLSASGEAGTVLDGVLALVAGRSPRAWTDADADRFPTQAQAVAHTYRAAAEQLGHATPDIEDQKTQYTQQLRSLKLDPQTLSPTQKTAARLALLQLLQELSD